MQVNTHLHKYRHLHVFCAVLLFYSLYVQFIQFLYDAPQWLRIKLFVIYKNDISVTIKEIQTN